MNKDFSFYTNLILNEKFDVWNRIKGLHHPISVLLSPNAFEKYSLLFDAHKLPFEIVDHNIQKYVLLKN